MQGCKQLNYNIELQAEHSAIILLNTFLVLHLY